MSIRILMMRTSLFLFCTIGAGIAARPVFFPCQQEQSRHADVFADVMCWQASETFDWSYILQLKFSGFPPVVNFETSTYQKLPFAWSPGFKVGFGYQMEHGFWDTQLYYTRFVTHAAANADAGTTGFLTSGFIGNRTADVGTYRTGSIQLKIDFNMFDWDLGRAICLGDALTLRPVIGAKAGWISQKICTAWQNPNFLGFGILLNSTENVRNNFRGVGPKGGLDSNWILGRVHDHTFSICADCSAAFMFGHWEITDVFHDNFNTTVNVIVPNRKFGAFMLQALAGFQWDVGPKDHPHFQLKLGYEIQDWLNQYQVFDNGTGSHANDLVLQGLTVRARFDF